MREYNRLYADDRGLWEEHRRGQALGTEWEEIVDVAGCVEEGTRGEPRVRILLGLANGGKTSMRGDRRGFAEVIEAMGRELPGMPAGWLARIERLQLTDTPLTIWRRSEHEVSPASGYPRLGADERGIWRENGPRRRFLAEWDKIKEVVGLGRLLPNDEVVCTGLKLRLVHQSPPLRLEAGWPGFAGVVETMTNRLGDMPAGWFDQITRMPRLTANADHMVDVPVWPKGYPRLYADDLGVWREARPGQRVGVAWGQILGVSCSFWEGNGGETLVSVQLEAERGGLSFGGTYGQTDERFLPDLVKAITARLGMPEGWYDRAKLMKPTRATLHVWSRPDPGFRLHADDHGVWEGDKLLAEWGKLLGVIARKSHERGRPEGAILIDLDVANAPCKTLHDSAEGFRDIVEAIVVRLPGVPAAGWFAEIERLQPGNAVTVWRLADQAGYPQLHADDRGVWRADMPGQPFGVEWDHIGRVLGSKKKDALGHLVVDLEWEGANHLFLESDMAGFAQVIEAITTRLPHMPAGWLEKIERLRPGYALWRRDWIIADEWLGPDGMLVTKWRRIES
jgi:hypothetical protein